MPDAGPLRGGSSVSLQTNLVGDRNYVINWGPANYDGAPGRSVPVTLIWSGDHSTLGPATQVEVQARIPSPGNQLGSGIGSSRVFTISGDSGSISFNIHLTSSPLSVSNNNVPRSGAIELHMTVRRTTAVDWSADNKGTRTGTASNESVYDWNRGHLRADVVIQSLFLWADAFVGTEPSLWAYGDGFYHRLVITASTYRSNVFSAAILQNGITLRTLSFSSLSQTQRSVSGGTLLQDFAIGPATQVLNLPTNEISGMADGYQREYKFTPEDLPPGLTAFVLNLNLQGVQARAVDRLNVDPTVTGELLELNVGPQTVFNRGQDQGGVLKIVQARGEGFPPLLSDELSLINPPNSVEQIITGFTKDTQTGIFTFSFIFNTTGNVAPLNTVGAEKFIRWRETSTSFGKASLPDFGPVGSLSSLYDVVDHLQNNVLELNPALKTNNRLTSDLGFYGVKVLDQRGNPINGAVGSLALRDKRSLVAQISRPNVATSSDGGFPGYTPLAAWDSQLPGGGWDLWATTAFTKDGNTGPMERPTPAQASTFALLAINANIVPIVVAGSPILSMGSGHFSPGHPLLVGMALFDISSRNLLAPDVDPQPSVMIGKFDSESGRATYLDSNGVWQFLVPGVSVFSHPLMDAFTVRDAQLRQEFPGQPESFYEGNNAADPRIYVLVVEDTISFNLVNTFFLGVSYVNGTPYQGLGDLEAVLGANDHKGYALDPLALALGGIISQR